MSEISPYSLGINFESIDPLKRRGNLVLITDELKESLLKTYISNCALECRKCTRQFICTGFTTEGTAFIVTDGNVKEGLIAINTPCSKYIVEPKGNK